MKTVLVTINTPGSTTGPLFNIFSSVDLVTPLVSGVTKTLLLAGYSVTTVPDAATSIRVQSTGTCTTYVDLSITTPTTTTTTTTTTVACTNIEYGYDQADAPAACAAAIDAPVTYQWNGTTLYDYNISSPCGPGSTVAASGYYSDGTDVYFWDGTTFTFDSTCGLYSLQTLTFQAKRGTGTISTTNNKVDIFVSLDSGENWYSVWTPFSHALSTSFAIVGQYQVFSGTDVWIGVKGKSSFIDIVFGVGNGVISNDYCGTYTYYNYGTVWSDATIYIQVPLSGSAYIACP